MNSGRDFANVISYTNQTIYVYREHSYPAGGAAWSGGGGFGRAIPLQAGASLQIDPAALGLIKWYGNFVLNRFARPCSAPKSETYTLSAYWCLLAWLQWCMVTFTYIGRFANFHFNSCSRYNGDYMCGATGAIEVIGRSGTLEKEWVPARVAGREFIFPAPRANPQ